MDIRTAILRAADSIEMNPDLFSFGSVHLPDKDCGSPSCALGWICHHAELKLGKYALDHAFAGDHIYKYLSIEDDCGFPALNEFGEGCSWRHSASKCARALRLYADKYHPASEKPESKQGIPQSVLDLFKEKVAA